MGRGEVTLYLNLLKINCISQKCHVVFAFSSVSALRAHGDIDVPNFNALNTLNVHVSQLGNLCRLLFSCQIKYLLDSK